MSVDRRSFFKGGLLAALFAGIPGSLSALAGQVQTHRRTAAIKSIKPFRVASDDSLARLSMDSFSPFVDTPFTVRGAKTSTVTVIMTQVTDLRSTPGELALAKQGREYFSLQFAGPDSTPLASGMYEFRNDSLGTFDLTIGPGAGSTYQATINRLYS